MAANTSMVGDLETYETDWKKDRAKHMLKKILSFKDRILRLFRKKNTKLKW